MASLDWRQGPLEDAGRGPQTRARLAAAVRKQKDKLVSHVPDADNDDDDDDDDHDHDHDDHDDDDDPKLVNSGTKIRPGIDKFYQPNSGLRSSKTEDKAIYIYMNYMNI